MSVWRSLPFRRAPLLLARHPSVAGAVAGAAAILALTGAAAPLFVASAASASVNDQVTARCAYTVGFTAFGAPTPAGAGSVTAGRAAFDRLAAGVGHLGPTVTTVQYGGTRDPLFLATEHGTVEFPVSVLHRDGEERNITILADSGRDGLLLPDGLARTLHVRAGDRVRLSSSASATVPVAAVYRDLNTEPKRPYWCDPTLDVYSKGLLDDNPPPPLLLARGDAVARALAPGRTPLTAYYERPLTAGLTEPRAAEVAAQLDAARTHLRLGYAARLNDRGKPMLFRTGAVNDLPVIARRADEVAQSLAATCTAIAAAGSVVALLLLGGAGLLWAERRRVEVRLLAARGVGPLALGVKGLLEMLPALAVGAAAGWAVSLWLVPAVGPSDVLPASTTGAAAVRTALVTVAGAAALVAVAAAAARRGTERPIGHRRSRLALVPWEAGLLVAAWAAYVAIRHRGLSTFADTTVPRLDAVQLLYPMLLISGGTLLAARLVVLALRWWRTRSTRLRGPAYLAGRRLAGAPGSAAVLVVAAALSVGVLTFASAMTSTLRYTVATKAEVFVGSDAQITLSEPLRRVPPALADRSTTVLSTDTTVPGVGHVDVLGVDPATFGRAAAWDERFAGPSLGTLMDELRAGGSGPRPALVVGGSPDRFTVPLIGLGGQVQRVPVRVVARPLAFPQQHGDVLVVVDRAALPEPIRQLSSVELWVRDWTPATQQALRDAGAGIRFVTTVADVSRAPDLAAVTWTYGFFESLGALTALIGIGGLLLHLATRQRSRALAYGLTRRMGLHRAAHAASVLIEVGAALVVGYVVGTGLATAAVALVYGRLDPEGDLPPGPLLRLPVTGYLALAAATAVVALAATALAQHTADRARTAELLRLGTA